MTVNVRGLQIPLCQRFLTKLTEKIFDITVSMQLKPFDIISNKLTGSEFYGEQQY